MSPSDQASSIADASKPNAGRIYDYLLGGKHNFEIDRQAAQRILENMPFMPQIFRLIRWFLGEATRRLVDKGFDKFLDFASGLPTQDHIHEVAPAGTKVIYSDKDPVTVEYAKEILKDNPNARYVHCDAGKPETLLNSEVLNEMFGKGRKVAIGFNGIVWFLNDEPFIHAMKTLYEWADEGSALFLTTANIAALSVSVKKMFDIYQKMGEPLFFRPREQILEMIKPWKIEEPGLVHIEQWLDMGDRVFRTQVEQGAMLEGAILTK